MKLEKDRETIVLLNPNHADAYKSAGWKEVKEEAKPPRKAKDK